MGFFATIGRGWEMSKLSMAVVKKDPELLVYMIIAGVMSLACLIGMSIPQFLEMEWAVNPDGSFTGAYLVFTFVAYMVLSIIVVFWNCAIIANANIRLTGGDPKFADGVSAAVKRLPLIIMWGIIAGTPCKISITRITAYAGAAITVQRAPRSIGIISGGATVAIAVEAARRRRGQPPAETATARTTCS